MTEDRALLEMVLSARGITILSFDPLELVDHREYWMRGKTAERFVNSLLESTAQLELNFGDKNNE